MKIVMEGVRHDKLCSLEMALSKQYRGIKEAGHRKWKRPRGGTRRGRGVRKATGFYGLASRANWNLACLLACCMQGTLLLWGSGLVGERMSCMIPRKSQVGLPASLFPSQLIPPLQPWD